MVANPQYRYDQLLFSTAIPNFINMGTADGSIPCSGTIANGSTANFSTNIAISDFSTFIDVKVSTASAATYLTNNVAIDPLWDYKSTETVQNSVSILGTLATVTISVSNFTGSSVTINSQTFNIEVIEYALPF